MNNGQMFRLRGQIRLEVNEGMYTSIIYPLVGHKIIIEDPAAKADNDLKNLLLKYLEPNGRGGLVFSNLSAPEVYMNVDDRTFEMPYFKIKCFDAEFMIQVVKSVDGFELFLFTSRSLLRVSCNTFLLFSISLILF